MRPRLLIDQLLVDKVERVVQIRRDLIVELLQLDDVLSFALIEELAHVQVLLESQR